MISGNLCHFIIKSTEIFSLPSPFFYSFIYFWLHWVFVGVHRLSTVVEGSGYSSLWCLVVLLWWLLLLQCMDSRRMGSVIVDACNGTPLQYSCLENPMDGGAW